MAQQPSIPLARDLLRLLRRIAGLWLAYIKGQFVMAVIVGAITWGVGEALGLAYALWLGALAGVLSLIPGLGQPIAALIASLVALWRGSTVLALPAWGFALVVLGAYLVIQQIANLVIEPHIVGKRLNLPPLVVLVGVLAGAAVGHVVGAYLAVPLMVTLREVVVFVWRKARGSPAFEDEHLSP